MALQDKLGVWRKDLIDMSRRNPLLFYRLDGPRPSGLSVPNADVTYLYDKVVKQRGALTEESLGLPDPEVDPLPLKRLERLRVQARDDVKERGIQSLYLAFGLLEWYEVGHSADPVRSPILLVPVAISSGGAKALYSIKLVEDEDVEINPTLRERLHSSFHIQLPTYDEIVSHLESLQANVSTGAMMGSAESRRATDQARHSPQTTPRKQRLSAPPLETVWGAVNAALDTLPDATRSNWKALPTVHLGRFSFQKLVMRQDLEHHEQEALAHPVLRRIAGERGALYEPSRLLAADQLDANVHPRDALEILDADSSQEEAIQAAKAGQSFVLQGPPGTGKSQTIANIIAESLAQGKTVLFVSEKMAALDVVRKRLEAAHLGEFLLDLHDARQNRREFVSKLDEAVRLAREAPSLAVSKQWERESESLAERRSLLNLYVRELHQPRFALGVTAFIAYGYLAQLRDAPASDFALTEDITTITPVHFDQMRDALRQLLDYEDVLDAYWSHTWRSTPLTSLSNEQTANIQDHFGRLSRALSAAEAELERMAMALGEQGASITFGWSTHACARTQLALESPLPPPGWFEAGGIERLRPMLTRARELATHYQHGLHALDSRYRASVYQLDHQAILDALTIDSESAIASIQAPLGHDPHDVALLQRHQLEHHLSASAALPPRLVESAEKVAELLNLPTPQTFDDIETLLRQATVVVETPMPPRSWLDPDDYAETRILALDATDKALWAKQARAELSAKYLPAYLEADLKPISQRFREQYDSITRYLRPQFYLDIRALRRFAQPESSHSVDELKTDIAQAVKLHQAEQWREEHRADLARLFGRRYNGEQTDWEQARRMVEWADTYHGLFTDETASDTITKLITGPASARVTLSGAVTTLATQWNAWEVEQTWMREYVHVNAMLGATTQSADETSPAVWAHALEGLSAGLRRYWQAADQVTEARLQDQTLLWRSLVDDIQHAQAVRRYDEWIVAHQAQLQRDLGVDFAGLTTDWDHVCSMADWVNDVVQLYSNDVPAALVKWIARGPAANEQRARMQETLTYAVRLLAEIEEELQYAESVIPRARFCPNHVAQDDTPLSTMRQLVDFHQDQLPQLGRWVACGQRIMRSRSLGMGSLIDASLKQKTFPRDIERVFERRFYSLWLDAAESQSPSLQRFSGDTQDRIIQEYRQLDLRHQQLAQQRLAMLLTKRRYDAYMRAANAMHSPVAEDRMFGKVYDQLVREATKKRSPAIREIVRKVREALIELKPCWMMSPLSVSQFVETAQPIFDLVIFDEASQVLTEDAICAIMRGKQLIVVGDEKQLPPTSFFAKSLADEADDDEDAESDSAEMERTESVLTEMKSANMHERSLKWHYRSQHESLIAFSNNEFYGDQLITFPGPGAQHRDGVRFIHVADGVYDRSGSRTNRREAERVVDLLIQLAQRDANASLGVVALSGAQQAAIRDALANRFKSHPELAVLRETLDEDAAGADAFFIKNLESVQGDERDIVVLSIGYGRDRHGQIYTHFGPVNRKGGERRLNVAVTRARKQMYVVSSMRAADLPPKLASGGARTLRRYLDYAERGPAALYESATTVAATAEIKQFDSPFEQAVYDAFCARGLELDTQIGCSGYRIDLAVRDPEQPDRYLLGIECDGASYHSSKTARDRDRLRQAHLESLGWSIHRIWSADWFADPEREIGKTLSALDRARATAPIRRTSERVS